MRLLDVPGAGPVDMRLCRNVAVAELPAGYGLSPVLWRKLPGCRSAGRVQSVALRLVCEREAEIEAFAPKAYWTVEAELAAQDGAPFPATLCRLDGDGIDGAGLASERMAKHAVERIRAGTFAVSSVERGALRRQPLPPFTTATLQQEAARRLGFGIGETMALAQRLYEGVDLGDETAGLVTYMRTDSTAMATTAVEQARAMVHQVVERPARLPCPHQVHVDGPGPDQRPAHCRRRDLVEDHPEHRPVPYRVPFGEPAQHLPGDRLALPVGVGGEHQDIGARQRLRDGPQRPGGALAGLVGHREAVAGIDRARPRRQVANMTAGRHHPV